MSHFTFVPFCTFVDTVFWAELNRRKLNEWRLDETPRELGGMISLCEFEICYFKVDCTGDMCRLSLSHESFEPSLPGAYSGRLLLVNTLDSFKRLDRKALLVDEAMKVWENIKSGMWLEEPICLMPFTFTVFADLKKFQYHYWNCYPAICYPTNIRQEVLFVVFADPSPVPGCAGWPLRNLLAAVAYFKRTWRWCSFISLRGVHRLSEFKISWDETEVCCFYNGATQLPASVGWERNSEGKLLSQFVDMRQQFDPKKLMEQSIELNLSLIKWRLVPEMQLVRCTSLKVLIFGAGTLGSNIARCLMGWGVKKITFLDNSSVSYSNPVRQSLSEFEDARRSRSKAETAATALQRIYPCIDSSAVCLTVPMPGMFSELCCIDVFLSFFSEENALERDLTIIDELVANHDVVFLALDSREARWLPTVLATKHGKMAFSVALGFDNYVVIRHGVRSYVQGVESGSGTVVPYSDLACYFCSDVTAPGNSSTDRTLDQQCTVSRAGLSMIASGIAVEMMASVLQYRDPLAAPANIGEPDDTSSLLGATPHQVRGYLSRFTQMTPCVRRFEKCVACGCTVVNEYVTRGVEFVKEVMNSPTYLEKLTGLDLLQASIDDVHVEFSDDNESIMSI
ncbi:unnamed protein product [Angiostrongylus costaricensis]|uniref:Ubiquitin-like modifier-activating enzyme ATG7 n=1 Tax=Angiostrongylus costaricensis TaxID=334426 RepID=A0A158PII8_ANGCS|nr:unnamed protein product [Angiostrongylus costaricensis]